MNPVSSGRALFGALFVSLILHALLIMAGQDPLPRTSGQATTPLQIALRPPEPSRPPPPQPSRTAAPVDEVPPDRRQAPVERPQTSRPPAAHPTDTVRTQRDSVALAPIEPAITSSRLLEQVRSMARTPESGSGTRVIYGSSATGPLWNQYVDDWVRKVERLGATNYPDEVRRRGLSGGPLLRVVLNADGSLARVTILRPASDPLLDEAAVAMVRMATPFAPFPTELATSAGQLELVRRWTFTKDNALSAR